MATYLRIKPGSTEPQASPALAPVRPFEEVRDRRRDVQLTKAFRREKQLLALMPDTAKALVELLGLDATLKLAKAEGGNELRIPDVVGGRSRTWTKLVDLIGDPAAARLVERYRHCGVYIPMCAAALRMERNLDILARYDQGEPFEEIRRRHNVSRSYLFRLLKKGAAAGEAEEGAGSAAATPPTASVEGRGASSADSALAVAVAGERGGL